MIDFLSVVLAIILLAGLFFQIRNTLNSIYRLRDTLNSIDSLYNIYNQTSLDSIDKNKGKNLDSLKLNNNMINNQPKLLTDILNHLAQSEEARERFNQNKNIYAILDGDQVKFNSSKDAEYGMPFYLDEEITQRFIIQTALSNTPDGQPVCELLGKEIFTKTSSFYEAIKKLGVVDIGQYATFNQVLYLIFTTTLFQGKSFEIALEETNAIYLENIK